MRITLAVALLVVAAASAASAATMGNDPKTLALQPGDVPAGTAMDGYASQPLPGGRDMAYEASYLIGGKEGVIEDVEVTKTLADANSRYKLAVLADAAWPPRKKTLVLPAYGNEQTAIFKYQTATGNAGFANQAGRAYAVLIVRKKTIVWRLLIENCSPLAEAGRCEGPTPPVITEAKALSELKTYAAKAKARIANG